MFSSRMRILYFEWKKSLTLSSIKLLIVGGAAIELTVSNCRGQAVPRSENNLQTLGSRSWLEIRYSCKICWSYANHFSLRYHFVFNFTKLVNTAQWSGTIWNWASQVCLRILKASNGDPIGALNLRTNKNCKLHNVSLSMQILHRLPQ